MRLPRIPVLLAVVFTVSLGLTAPNAVGAAAAAERSKPEPYELLQLNVCLSGLAGCFGGTEYPKVVDEAIATIQAEDPDAVTVNEACSGDIQAIADATGYEFWFATVLYNGAPLPCRNPGGRGVFGNAVLADGQIVSSQGEAFEAQSGAEERRWLCVVTDDDVRVCTAHLSVAGSAEQAATNEAQCKELSTILRQHGQRRATVFGGDVNRRTICAPAGFWTLTDAAATQAPGIQQVYGSRARLRKPQVETLPMTYTDHDAVLARALLRRAGKPTTGHDT